MLIIRAEEKAVAGNAVLYRAGDDIGEVPCGGALPHLHIHPCAQALERFPIGAALVVGLHAAEAVGLQRLASDHGGVPVDHLIPQEVDFFVELRRAVDHRDIIHRFAEAEHTGVIPVALHFLCRVSGAVVLEGAERHAGGKHEKNIHGGAFRVFEHIIEPARAADVHDLMRVGHNGGGAVGKHPRSKDRRGYHGGFDVHVRIDKAGCNIFAREILLLHALVFAYSGDIPFVNSDIARVEGFGADVHDRCVLQHQLRRAFPPGNGKQFVSKRRFHTVYLVS